MVKKSGLGDRFFVGGYDLSGDVGSLSKIGGGPALLDITAINGSARERIGATRDGEISFSAFFNDAAGASHVVLSALPTADVVGMYFRGAAVGGFGAFVNAKQVSYDLNRGADASLTANIQLLANQYGVMWGENLTAGLRTESTATNGASIDFGAVSTLFGLSAAINVTALASGSPTVLIQDSADDSTFANVTGATFGVVAAQTNSIIQTAIGATVRRYVRVITTGTFSGLSFAVIFTRHGVSTI